MTETPQKSAPHRRKVWGPIRYAHARPRLLVGAAVAVVAAAALEFSGMPRSLPLLLGFDLGAVVYFVLLLRIFVGASPATMRRQAKQQDTGRWTTLLSGVVLSAVVLGAVTTELNSSDKGGALAIAVAATTIILAWTFMNTLFSLHYAHGYYGEFGKPHQGLDFPGDEEPDYWDFAYFAFTIGMTFQVSDVQITTRYLRRIGLMHSAIAFFFNVFIIAISVNIAAGKA
ncbi:MAG: DUF1345 domain-containing protein [Luteibacter sp.]|jgi:uncharacterized membrane protein|uniref:DUF1345 domain-containing protein n=1 Tax=Luteibacter sp. 22Crub2.1 TaxID=1283288 RepID=UPI0005BE9652|nr:DUF1345 domain-containing protein [Luteibacter sp. 22Crub2.1]MDQ7995408.1 DUF1345 domain-containing protein [Luteibacter sp.]SDG86746.1 Uncharacterized membrane protein [Dyella sp. 333MFSha]SKB77268.1 Uncharacterized membrane protein [Luteibacter sp. 22Crub2.1]